MGDVDFIEIKESLDPKNAIICARYILTRSSHKKFLYDFSKMQNCHPVGMLVIINAIHANMKKYPMAIHTPCLGSTQGCGYAEHLGFFEALGWGDESVVTKDKDFVTNDSACIPIRKIISDSIEGFISEGACLEEKIEVLSKQLSTTLLQQADSEANKALTYCIREIIRNVFEHSQSDAVWVCGQFWPSKNCAQIAIMDEGRGIRASLLGNRRYAVQSNEDALKLALQPGVTRTFGQKQDPNNIWQNSGYGLFVASALCALGGYFILSSGDRSVFLSGQRQKVSHVEIRGTLVCLKMDLGSTDNIDSKIQKITTHGAEIAKHQKDRVLRASQVSSVASILSQLDVSKRII